MRIADARARLLALMAERGSEPTSIRPAEAVQLMLDWYRTERCEDAEDEDRGDMLLFQWGTFDWGAGEWFEYDITRQLVAEAEPEDADSAIWQVAITFRYPPGPAAALGEGAHWWEQPRRLDEFEAYIQDCAATAYVGTAKPARVDITFEAAG